MYTWKQIADEIKLKTDSPSSWFASESVSPVFLPHARITKKLQNSYFYFIFVVVDVVVWSGRSFVFTNNATPWTSKTRNRWLDPTWRQPYQFQVQSLIKVCFDCSRRQSPNDPFPLEIFLSPLRCPCWLRCVLMCKSKFSWIICGLQRYVSVRTSVRFLLDSITAAISYEVQAA